MSATHDAFDTDLFVIGGGSGGVRAARMAAQRGARVMLAEALGQHGLGGTCVNLGCIPKKLYSYAAHYGHAFHEAAGFGWQAPSPRFDWSVLQENRRKEIARLNGVYAGLLAGSGVQMLAARAGLADPHTVVLDDGRRFRARHILIATGGRPHVPDFPGSEHVLTSDAIFDLSPFPARLLVVGGGYIACEFASIFNGLGARVTQLYRGPQILRGFDHDIARFLTDETRKKGVDLRLHADVASIAPTPGGLQVQLIDGSALEVDAVLYATGRKPNVDGLHLAAAGIAQQPDGAIITDAHYRTSAPSVFAVGDVIGRVQLTPVALAEAMVVVDLLFGDGQRGISYDYIPTAVFTDPNVGTVGLSEAQARERCGDITVFCSEFRALKHTLSGSSERTLMKLIVDRASDRVVGLHMVGPDAGEIVQGFAVAMKAGATKAVFDSTIGIHPTAAEEFVTMRTPVAS
ncbi:glutathione-disulfide reductase [Massilia sp. TS11]|uniref:glutathione-disulfide reductase n=1 Tax=Massilia sp. TS11 TaxID=2908003 RepID=UPI001EDB2361|nr:glutathione-disulfide reductase [Massilia sp. TS11]MCG2583060.1 glutathione-disulfide reductase [Massilia sp. TS11]